MKAYRQNICFPKRILSLIMAAVLSVLCCAAAQAAIPGDVDGDGEVSSADAR